jgi:hypothetical protein
MGPKIFELPYQHPGSMKGLGPEKWTCGKETPVPLGGWGPCQDPIALPIGEDRELARKGRQNEPERGLPAALRVSDVPCAILGRCSSMEKGSRCWGWISVTGSAPSSHRGRVTGGVAGPRFQALQGVSARLSFRCVHGRDTSWPIAPSWVRHRPDLLETRRSVPMSLLNEKSEFVRCYQCGRSPARWMQRMS